MRDFWLGGLIGALFVCLLFGPSAQASFQLEWEEGAERQGGIVGQPGGSRLLSTVPTEPVEPRNRDSGPPVRYGQGYGSCYVGPGTPPASVLAAENVGLGPQAVNQQGSSASGCWQILDGTWGGYGGYARAKDAPVSVQNAKAAELWAGGSGCSHWAAVGAC